MKKALITGGAGFIGSYLAEGLLSQGYKVTVIDDLSTGSLENIKHLKSDKNFKIIVDTIMNQKLMERLIKKTDLVYHLAATVGVKFIIDNPVKSIETNVFGTEIILSLVSKYNKKIIIASTSEIYGKDGNVPFKEDGDRTLGSTKLHRWSYSCGKALDEFLSLAYFREKKTPVVIVRFFNTCGPRQSGEYGMVIPRFIKQALLNQPITVYGDGKQRRCFSYVEDVVDAVIKLSCNDEAIGDIFNIGSDEEISIEDLAYKVKDMTNSSSSISFMRYDDVYGSDFEDMQRRVPDLSKIKKIINYSPQTNLDSLLKVTIESFKK